MDVFELRERLVGDYGSYIGSFIRIKDARIEEQVRQSLDEGLLWPDPLIQLNPSFEAGETIDELAREGVLHEKCARICRTNKGRCDRGKDLKLHRYQAEAVRTAHAGHNSVLTTGDVLSVPIIIKHLLSGFQAYVACTSGYVDRSKK